jgi:hypothetical protein
MDEDDKVNDVTADEREDLNRNGIDDEIVAVRMPGPAVLTLRFRQIRSGTETILFSGTWMSYEPVRPRQGPIRVT